MRPPCFLLVEPGMPEGLSARKLMLETKKYNVISAYLAEHAVQSFAAFPNVDAVVIHSEMRDLPWHEIVEQMRGIAKLKRLVVLTPHPDALTVHECDAVVSSYHPEELLSELKRIFGDVQQQVIAPSANPGQN
jgi:DNA-binding NarL/FixJ family response regulator